MILTMDSRFSKTNIAQNAPTSTAKNSSCVGQQANASIKTTLCAANAQMVCGTCNSLSLSSLPPPPCSLSLSLSFSLNHECAECACCSRAIGFVRPSTQHVPPMMTAQQTSIVLTERPPTARDTITVLLCRGVNTLTTRLIGNAPQVTSERPLEAAPLPYPTLTLSLTLSLTSTAVTSLIQQHLCFTS